MKVDESQNKRPTGRKKQETTRPQWRVRLPASVGDEITAAAKAEGRSISEEIEYRLVRYSHLENEYITLIDIADQQSAKMQEMVHDVRTFLAKIINQDHGNKGDLQQLGFTRVELPGGDVIWLEPGNREAPSPSLVYAALAAEQLAPVLREALINTILSVKEGKA